jgi:hypothetical protein
MNFSQSNDPDVLDAFADAIEFMAGVAHDTVLGQAFPAAHRKRSTAYTLRDAAGYRARATRLRAAAHAA